MRSIQWSVWALVFCACTAQAGVNSWSVRGPLGGHVVDIIIDPVQPEVAYAAGSSALYKSVDGGLTWVEMVHDFGGYAISDIAFDPADSARIYVGAGRGLFRSTDRAETFTRITPLVLDPNEGPSSLIISANGNTIYYGTPGRLFFCSVDGGTTFTEQSTLPSLSQQFAIDPSNDAVLYAAAGYNLLRSIDRGVHWVQLPMPASALAVSVLLVPGTPNTVWLNTSAGLFSTTNDGAAWTPSGRAELGGHKLFASPHSSDGFYVASRTSARPIYRHAAGAWQPSAIVPDVVRALAVSAADPRNILIGTSMGVWRTANGGVDWVRSNRGFYSGAGMPMATGAGRLYAGTNHGELYMTEDDSELQVMANSPGALDPLSNLSITAVAAHPSDEYAVLIGLGNDGVLHLSDDGTVWLPSSLETSTSGFVNALAFAPTNADIAYAALWFGGLPGNSIRRSTDGGATFSVVTNNLPDVLSVERLAVDPANSARVFLASGTAPAGIYRSEDSGATWTTVLSSNSSVVDIAIDQADSQRIYALANNTVMASDDGGDTFTANTALPRETFGRLHAIALDPLDSNVIYISSSLFVPPATEFFIMRSVDRGTAWERVPNSASPHWSPYELILSSATPTVLFTQLGGRGLQSFEIAPDLSIGVTGHSGELPLAQPTTFQVYIDNSGPLSATGVELHISLPSGAENISASIDAGSCAVNAQGAQCSLPHVKVDARATATISYTPASPGEQVVQANVTARERDPVATNNAASATATTAAETVDLALTGSASALTVNQGAAFAYTFQLQNAGPSSSTTTLVSIEVDAAATIVSASPDGCTVSGNSVECNLGVLEVGASTVITVNANATTAGTLRATGTANAAVSAIEVSAANNVAAVDVTSQAAPISGGGGSGGSTGGGGGGTTSVPFLFVLLLVRFGAFRHRTYSQFAHG